MNSDNENAFVLRSTVSEKRLVISDIAKEEYSVSFESVDLRVTKLVSSYMTPYGIPDFLDQLGSYSKPWDSRIVFETLEGEFSLLAECSSLGIVTFLIELKNQSENEDWRFQVEISTELGQLPLLASNSRKVFELAYS